MTQRVPSALETKLCRDLRLWLGTADEESSDFRDVLTALEYFIPELLREHCAEWPFDESLDQPYVS